MTATPREDLIIDTIILGLRTIDDNQSNIDQLRESLGSFVRGNTSIDHCFKIAEPLKNGKRIVEALHEVVSAKDTPAATTYRPEKQIMPEWNGQRSKRRDWVHEEDVRLLAGILRYGLKDWSSVAGFVGNGRVRSQCSQRWIRGLDPSISRKKWTEEEDVMLKELVMKHGAKNWTKISKSMPGRNDIQCRYRHILLSKGKKDVGETVRGDEGGRSHKEVWPDETDFFVFGDFNAKSVPEWDLF
jgi:hypothetical protein